MQWLNSLVSEYEGRPLQKTGMLTKEQLLTFFQESTKQFSNPEFKQLVSLSVKARGSAGAEDVINGMQREIFQSNGIQGDFGIKCLSKVNQVYTDDAFFLQQFYEHVQKEEMVLDEAEMPEPLFKAKYEQLNRMRSEMEARLSQLKGMSPQEQSAFMSGLYREMLTHSAGGGDCCSNPDGCSHTHGHSHGPQPPPAQDAPSAAEAAIPTLGMGPGRGSSSAMTEAEQLAFFSSLGGGASKQ